MTDALKTDLLTPEEAVSRASTATAPNGVRYATLGRLDAPNTTPAEIARMVGAVPALLAGALNKHVYVFVPLALSAARLEGDESTPFSITDRTFSGCILPMATNGFSVSRRMPAMPSRPH